MEYEVVEYLDEQDKAQFGTWFNRLNPLAAAKVTTAIKRLVQGNNSNVKRLPGGIFEYKLHFGPGYRIYFGKHKKTIVVLLIGGTKKRQSADIAKAKLFWKNFLERS